MKVTILCENTAAGPNLIGEHGFAALIETGEETILFDTGAGLGLIHNAQALGKDLSQVGKLLISHGHFDHTEGLLKALRAARRPVMMAHPEMFAPRVAVLGALRLYIGCPFRREQVELMVSELVLSAEPQAVATGLTLTGQVPRVTEFEERDPRLFLIQPDGGLAPDDFPDDQSLVMETEEGLVVIFGCAHAGMINTIRYAQTLTGQTRVRALLGGTHLDFLSPAQLEASIEELTRLDPGLVGVSHCTGQRAAARLMTQFGDRFRFASVGSVFEF